MKMTLEVMEPKPHFINEAKTEAQRGDMTCSKSHSDAMTDGEQEAMNPARALSTANVLTGGWRAQPLSQKTTFQLHVLVLLAQLSFFEKQKERKKKANNVLYTLLESFKQMSVGLQEILNIYKIF